MANRKMNDPKPGICQDWTELAYALIAAILIGGVLWVSVIILFLS